MRSHPLLLVACLLTSLSIAGCSNDANGQSAAGAGNLAYNGASDGTHRDEFEASGTCSLHLSANLGSGTVRAVLRTPTGTTVEGSHSGPGQKDAHLGEATGPSGTWTLTATRSGSFTGQYIARADC